MKEDLSFEIVDQKLQYLLDAVCVDHALLKILDNIIDNSANQSNKDYYNALEQFEKEYVIPGLN